MDNRKVIEERKLIEIFVSMLLLLVVITLKAI